MQNNSSKNDILNKIEAASKRRLNFIENVSDKEIYKPIDPDKVTCFKSELTAINGNCIVCENEDNLYIKIKDFVLHNKIDILHCRDSKISSKLKDYKIQNTNNPEEFTEMEAGITTCEFLIARTGSVVVSSASESGRQMNVFPPIHLVIAFESQLVDYPEDALIAINEKYGHALPSTITTITGPSRTADIEKTLVLGAHGPKEFVVFLCKE